MFFKITNIIIIKFKITNIIIINLLEPQDLGERGL